MYSITLSCVPTRTLEDRLKHWRANQTSALLWTLWFPGTLDQLANLVEPQITSVAVVSEHGGDSVVVRRAHTPP